MNLTELEKLADAALEKEPLEVDEDLTIHGSTSWCRTQRGFIAAANPQQIKAMIAVMRQMGDALTNYSMLISHQYTGSSEAMTFLQNCDADGQTALAAYAALMKGEMK